jgi:hypothetical protein
MNVNELILELQKVIDKSKQVSFLNVTEEAIGVEFYEEIDVVDEQEHGVYVL